jgi:hypothetical protein
MGDNSELRQKLSSFLLTEWQRKDQRQLVAVDLFYTPLDGFRDEAIRNWVRADDPDLFADFISVERLATQIIEIAEDEVEAKPPGKHRFVVRCAQRAGSRPQFAFSLTPAFHGSSDDALVPVVGGDGGSRDLKETIRVLCQQVTELTAENAALRRELEDERCAVHEKKPSHTKGKARRAVHARS